MAESLPGPSVERKERLVVVQDLNLVGLFQRILATSSATSNKFAYCKLL